ncbi:MAG: heparinase II/III family protein, partial [Planctomycetes bacterium]|nr:heparinase II/III family protein [Planctomycetota bacterium]
VHNKYYRKDGTKVNLGGGPSEHGGINWKAAFVDAHEFKRQGALATLACAWEQATSKRRKQLYARTFERWLRSRVTANPFVLMPGFHREAFAEFGGRYNEQQTTSYILFNWGAAVDSGMFRTPGALPDEFAFFFLKQYWFRVFNYTRLIGSSWRADNHHLMERGVALYYAGVQFPEFKRAREMEEYARLIILRHFDYNLLPDNVGSEHCTAYNYRCLVRYALPTSVARANGRTLLGPDRERRLKDWLEFTAFITAPDGRLVDTGDGAASSLALIAHETGAMFGNAVVKGVLGSLGKFEPVNPEFRSEWRKLKPLVPKDGSRIYPWAGHVVMRDGWKPGSMFLHSSIKSRSLYNVHAHWNVYAFTFAANGKRLIGNPAARTYGLPTGATRGFYFSMDAHNTLIIDDDNLKSHRALAGQWGLQPTRIHSAHTCLNAGSCDYASFTHRGYLPLVHRRDILFIRGRYVIMTDGITMDFADFNAVFDSEGDIRPHLYRQRIHFEQGVRAKRVGGGVAAHDRKTGAGVLMCPEPFENLRVNVAPNEYMAALDSPDFRGYEMADVFRETIGPCFFSTVYYPYAGDVPPPVAVTPLTPRTTPYRDDRHHAIRVTDGADIDYWFVQREMEKPRMCTVEAADVSLATDAACLFVSTRRGRVRDVFMCGGRRAELNGKRLEAKALEITRDF